MVDWILFSVDLVYCKQYLVVNQMWSLSDKPPCFWGILIMFTECGYTLDVHGVPVGFNCWFVRHGDFLMWSCWLRNVWRTRRCFAFEDPHSFLGSCWLYSPQSSGLFARRLQDPALRTPWNKGELLPTTGNALSMQNNGSTRKEIKPNLSVSESRLEGWLSMPVRNNTKRFGWERKVPWTFPVLYMVDAVVSDCQPFDLCEKEQ